MFKYGSGPWPGSERNPDPDGKMNRISNAATVSTNYIKSIQGRRAEVLEREGASAFSSWVATSFCLKPSPFLKNRLSQDRSAVRKNRKRKSQLINFRL